MYGRSIEFACCAVLRCAGGPAEHPWLRDVQQAPDTPLGEVVFSRMKQFTTMNKLKKKALLVRKLPPPSLMTFPKSSLPKVLLSV